MKNYEVKKGIIYSENGLPYAPRWFCDGRVVFQADNDGITEINYFGSKTSWQYIAFMKRFWKGIYFYAVGETGRFAIKPKQCEVYPFGYKNITEVCEQWVYTSDDCIYITFHMRDGFAPAIEFYDDFLFYPETRAEKDVRYGGPQRTWQKPELTDKGIVCGYTEGEYQTNILMSANAELGFKRTSGNIKNIINMSERSEQAEYVLAISLANGEPRDWTGYDLALEKQLTRYQKVADKAPVLESGRPMLVQFFQLAPMYHESLKTRDILGAIRAQSTHYWVWGWDSMTSNEASVYWGDAEFIGQMLACMERYADEKGIAHAFSRDMKNCEKTAAPPPAQGMYITLLDLYRLAGGDWKKYYPFAERIFEMIRATEVRDTGLCIGTSLYPDFRNLIKETGNDISTFNNTVSYCAICSMVKLAEEMHDEETTVAARNFGNRMRESFETHLYNEKFGFLDSSIEADTYERRGVLSNNAVKWENNYCRHLIEGHAEEYLRFYGAHLLSPAGIRPLPEWSDCYDADSNQLHCWWPVMSEFYTRLANQFGRTDLLAQYAEWVEYWSERLMCPEGIPCYGNDKEVPFDNWNCLCGIWHGYSIRGFYNAIVHSYVGVDFGEEGLQIYSCAEEELALSNLHFGKHSFDIKRSGMGSDVEKVIFNGQDLGAVSVVPRELWKEHNTVSVICKKDRA